MLDSIYHLTLKFIKNLMFGVKKSMKTPRFCHLLSSYYGRHYNMPPSVYHWRFTDFIAWRYMTQRGDVVMKNYFNHFPAAHDNCCRPALSYAL